MADIQQNRKLRIGDVLKELDYINDDELEEALAYQREHRGVRLGQTLIDLGYITEDQLLDALSKRLDVPLVDIGAVDVDIDAVRLVPENIAQETSTLPIAATDSTITIVTDDPLNFYGIEEIRQLTGRSVEVKLAKHTPIVRA